MEKLTMRKNTIIASLIAVGVVIGIVIGLAANVSARPAKPDNQTTLATAASRQIGAFHFAFSAKDLYGNDITEESLDEKEIFFVHYWATWCPPCVVEMPDIAEIANKYGDRVGFIGLLDDYDSNRQGAISIKESAGVTFATIDANTEGLEAVLAMLSTGYVPTTIILNCDGDMIGEAIIGAHREGYGRFLDAALD